MNILRVKCKCLHLKRFYTVVTDVFIQIKQGCIAFCDIITPDSLTWWMYRFGSSYLWGTARRCPRRSGRCESPPWSPAGWGRGAASWRPSQHRASLSDSPRGGTRTRTPELPCYAPSGPAESLCVYRVCGAALCVPCAHIWTSCYITNYYCHLLRCSNHSLLCGSCFLRNFLNPFMGKHLTHFPHQDLLLKAHIQPVPDLSRKCESVFIQ